MIEKLAENPKAEECGVRISIIGMVLIPFILIAVFFFFGCSTVSTASNSVIKDPLDRMMADETGIVILQQRLLENARILKMECTDQEYSYRCLTGKQLYDRNKAEVWPEWEKL